MAQRQLVDPLEQHRQALSRPDGLEERIEAGGRSVIAQQPLRDRSQVPIQSSSKGSEISSSAWVRSRCAVAFEEAMTSTCSGPVPSPASQARRRASASVLPVPAAPSTSRGPSPCRIARSCGSESSIPVPTRSVPCELPSGIDQQASDLARTAGANCGGQAGMWARLALTSCLSAAREARRQPAPKPTHRMAGDLPADRRCPARPLRGGSRQRRAHPVRGVGRAAIGRSCSTAAARTSSLPSSSSSPRRASRSPRSPRSAARSPSAKRGATRVVIDPIDGSLNVRRTIPSHSLSLAVASADSMEAVEFGYVYDFGAGEEFAAQLGAGATLNGEPLRAEAPQSDRPWRWSESRLPSRSGWAGDGGAGR